MHFYFQHTRIKCRCIMNNIQQVYSVIGLQVDYTLPCVGGVYTILAYSILISFGIISRPAQRNVVNWWREMEEWNSK